MIIKGKEITVQVRLIKANSKIWTNSSKYNKQIDL
jgi:hypothetical protein